MYECIVFDFDGLILDTETTQFIGWERTFRHFGVAPINLDDWTQSMGRHEDDPARLKPLDRLLTALDRELDDEIQRVRRSYRDDLLDVQPVQPGVEQLLDEANSRGIPVAIASSSPVSWIERHLRPRGLFERFATVSCAGGGVPGKPDPAVYLLACQTLGADPRRSLALEDSPHGAAAAKAAGNDLLRRANARLSASSTSMASIKYSRAWNRCRSATHQPERSTHTRTTSALRYTGRFGGECHRGWRRSAELALRLSRRSDEVLMNSVKDDPDALVIGRGDPAHLPFGERKLAPGMIAIANPLGDQEQQRIEDEEPRPGR